MDFILLRDVLLVDQITRLQVSIDIHGPMVTDCQRPISHGPPYWVPSATLKRLAHEVVHHSQRLREEEGVHEQFPAALAETWKIVGIDTPHDAQCVPVSRVC